MGRQQGAVSRSVTKTRLAVTILIVFLGASEALTTSAWFDPNEVPDWLATPIVMVGFFGVIFLWSFIGNGAIAIGSLIVIWRSWRWPLWIAGLISLPFWIVAYRLSPKPW